MNGWNRERKMEKKRNEKGGGTNERTNERWRKNELEIIKKQQRRIFQKRKMDPRPLAQEILPHLPDFMKCI